MGRLFLFRNQDGEMTDILEILFIPILLLLLP